MAENDLAVIPAAELAGLFDPRVEGSLTDEERGLLAVLILQDDRVDVAIPDTIDDDSLWDALQVCCKVERNCRRVSTVLKMLVGRALILMEKRPEMYKSRGFDSLNALISNKVRGLPATMGITRSELYRAKGVAESFPTLSMSEFREVGFNKMAMISQVVTEKDSNAQEWLDRAKTSTMEQLEDAIYRSNNNIPVGSLEMDTLTITLNKAEKDEIEEFLGKPEWQAYCGTGQPAAMLLRAIQESTTEWGIQVREEEDAG